MATIVKVLNGIFTKNVNGTIYSYSYNLYSFPVIQFSILLVSGSATMQATVSGNSPIIGDTINLPLGVPINLTANNNLPLGDFTINATAGNVVIIGTVNNSQ